MTVWSRLPLSGSVNGRPIAILSTASPGTTIHTVSTATAVRDSVYGWVWNMATTNSILTIEWGGTATLDQMVLTIPAQDGAYAVLPGMTLVGATDIVVRGFATATNRLFFGGYTDRAT